MKRTPLILSFLGLLHACGGEERASKNAEPAVGPAAAAASDHGERMDLGSVTISGYEFTMVRLGEFTPGTESALEVHLVNAPAGKTASDLNVYAWVEDESGTPVSAPIKGILEGDAFHCHVMPRESEHPLVRAVLRLRVDDIDATGSLPLDGHGHEHVQTPHDGVLSQFSGPDGAAGHLELKLHDDKGDLELWLATNPQLTEPFDLPLDSTIAVKFIDVQGRTVDLKVRNTSQNEDENGMANIRGGRTHYFIYPTSEDQDASWLMGTEFQSIIQVSFEVNGARYVSEEFVLTPHTHSP